MKRNNRENRMETLKNAGINTNNFFNLNMNVPVGSKVEILIDGVPYTISSDTIVNKIMKNGYVFNSRVDGRWVTAETFRLLGNIQQLNNWKYISDWDKNFKNSYGYMYQFEMMKDELKRLEKMEKNPDEDFERLRRFFSKEVVIGTCNHYMYQLRKFVGSMDKEHPRKCKGKRYVRLNKYRDVFLTDLNEKVYKPMEEIIYDMRNAKTYKKLRKEYTNFYYKLCKLPFDTPKCEAWKTAFKGKGAYVTLLNIVKFHGCEVPNYETGEILDTYESVQYVENQCETLYPHEYWKLHELLKATIVQNDFDLKESIKKNS